MKNNLKCLIIILIGSFNIMYAQIDSISNIDEFSYDVYESTSKIHNTNYVIKSGKYFLELDGVDIPDKLKINDIEMLVNFLSSEDKDWISNLILYNYAKRDAINFHFFRINYKNWKKYYKNDDLIFWRNYLKELKN